MTSARTGTARGTDRGPAPLPRAQRATAAILGLLLAASLLLVLLEAVASYIPLYREALRQAAAADQSLLTETDFETALRRTLDYTRGRIPELQMYVARRDPSAAEPAFSQRELQHMADVRALFSSAKLVRAVALAALLGALALTGLQGRRRRGREAGGAPSGQERLRAFWGRTLLWSAGWSLALVAAVTALALVDFRWIFDQFHYLFFSNDLWLLPVDSLLITMLPEWQFARLAGVIGGSFAVLETIAALAGRRLLAAARPSSHL